MNNFVLILFAATLMVFGCSEQENKPEDKQEIVDHNASNANSNISQAAAVAKDDSQAKPKREVSIHDGDVTLNKGKKWQSNTQIKALISEIQSKIDAYKSSANFDRDVAVRELKQYVQKLISNAKLAGESQNQFYNWTTKYMRSIVKLSEASTQEQMNVALSEIDNNLNEYNQKFE